MLRLFSIIVPICRLCQYVWSKAASLHIYPLHNVYGAVFSRGVTVFRDTQANGYKLLVRPFKVNMLAVDAHRNPRTIVVGGEMRYTRSEETYMINKVRTILRVAYKNGQTYLVLGALGCGAFHNPPKHVEQIFKMVLEEPEFKGIFHYVYFAIISDHNSMEIMRHLRMFFLPDSISKILN